MNVQQCIFLCGWLVNRLIPKFLGQLVFWKTSIQKGQKRPLLVIFGLVSTCFGPLLTPNWCCAVLSRSFGRSINLRDFWQRKCMHFWPVHFVGLQAHLPPLSRKRCSVKICSLPSLMRHMCHLYIHVEGTMYIRRSQKYDHSGAFPEQDHTQIFDPSNSLNT